MSQKKHWNEAQKSCNPPSSIWTRQCDGWSLTKCNLVSDLLPIVPRSSIDYFLCLAESEHKTLPYRLGFEIFLSNKNNFESLERQEWVLCRAREEIRFTNAILVAQYGPRWNRRKTRWSITKTHVETGKKNTLKWGRKTHWNGEERVMSKSYAIFNNRCMNIHR